MWNKRNIHEGTAFAHTERGARTLSRPSTSPILRVAPLSLSQAVSARDNLRPAQEHIMADQFNYDVFLSHSSQDKASVRPLAERLRADGLCVWFDE